MQDDPETTRTSLDSTPELERLLGRLSRRLSGKVWLHGLGTLLGICSVWLVFAFFADWALHVPKGVRWFHLIVALALPGFLFWRHLVRYLRRRPDRAGLAILLERAHPELRELLVSAVQLQQSRQPDGDPELVDSVLRDANRQAGHLDLAGVLEERAPRRRFAFGGALAAVVLAAALLEPTYASIFVRRLVGSDVPWPQLTFLNLTIPNLSDSARIRRFEGGVEVRVARGTDVPVLVRADGRVPSEVTLHFRSGHKVVLGPSGGGIFRTLLRSCQEDLEFHATGGDDRDGLPVVRVVVLEPPDVAGLAVPRIEPPAYSGLAPRTEYDRDVEVLAGSELRVVMLPDPPEVKGRVRILPQDRELELIPLPYPGEATQGLGFELEVSSSMRYRFEIVDASGLSNPDPGLFAVQVVPDRNPEIEIVSPSRLEIDTVPGGTVAIRARVDDDFGVREVVWTGRSATAEEEDRRVTPLEPRPAPRGESSGDSALAGARIEVASLAPAADPDAEGGLSRLAGEQFLIDVRAVDNRPGPAASDGAPLAAADWATAPGREGVGLSNPVRVRVVSEDEYLRRVQDRLSRLRLTVTELEELQRQKNQRTRELLASLESDDPEVGASNTELAAALTGQRRVLGDAQAVTQEFASIVESLLYSRLDEKAASMLEELDARMALATTRSFQPELWRELCDSWAETRGTGPGLAVQLVGLLDLSLQISLDAAAAAAGSLDEATRAVDLAGVHENLMAADRHQEEARARMEQLLGHLAEWDNFQSILSLTRDILNRQKALRDRTREFAREK